MNNGIIAEDIEDSADDEQQNEPAGLDSTYVKEEAADGTFIMDPNATFDVGNGDGK